MRKLFLRLKFFVLNIKDFITLIIALFALFISCLTFYYNNLRVNDNVAVRLIDVSLDNYSSNIIVNLAIINLGNRQGIVKEADYYVLDTFKYHKNYGGSFNAWGGIMENKGKDNFPLLIQPGEVKFIELSFPTSDFTGHFDSSFSVLSDVKSLDKDVQPRKVCKKTFYISFYSIDSKGRSHGKQSNVVPYLITYTDREIESVIFFGKDNHEFEIINLYDD